MAFDFFGLKDAVKVVGNVVDDLHTSDEERLKAELDFKKLDQELMLGQIEVNKEEAKHKSIFVAGARPFIIWVGGFAMAWSGVIHPLLTWIWFFVGVEGEPPPLIESATLSAVVTGLLGVAGMRSFDKSKGVETNNFSKIK